MQKFKPLSDLKSDFKKVSWLPKQELWLQTRIVLASILIVGCLVYGADVLVQSGITLITGILKWMMR